MKLLCVLCVLCGLFNSQSFTQSWEPKPIDYAEEQPVKTIYYEIKGDIPQAAFKLLVNGYRFFISEPDGENCPFSPSCSRFFVEALGQTNIVESILLTSDRLIRDTSFGDKYKRYHTDGNGYLIDPPSRYISGN